MKIRNGFVSNSSSSSFLLDDSYTCADIAKMVASVIYESNLIYLGKSIQNIDTLEDKNVPIYFEWCDNIEIFRVKEGIYFEGSQHIDWRCLPLADSDFYLDDEIYEEEDSANRVFYYPLWNMFGKLAISQLNCHSISEWKCDVCGYKRIIHSTGFNVCPNCLTDPEGKKISYFFRDAKLERILKIK